MRIFATTTAAAALMLVSAAYAQDTQLYVTQDASGNRMVMGGEMAEGAPVLMGENGNRPADCPAGSYYEGAQGQVFPCEGESAGFAMTAPGADMMMPDGQPYPEGAMLLQPNQTPVGDSGTQKSDVGTRTRAEGGSENNQAGGNVGGSAPQ